MTERPILARWRDKPGLLVAAVVLTACCWIVGNPRSSGPDEPSHMVASAALVRGHREGRVNPDPLAPGTHLFDVPGMVGQPDPGCWAFQPEIPVACANAQPLSTESRELSTLSYNYPPWALILPGLASFVPSAGGYAYLARLLNAAIPVALVAASLLTLVRRRPILAASALLGLTPIAWFTFGFVSPSAVAIGGGLALWTGLLVDRARATAWLTVAGWAAVMLARRDGPVWAVLIVLACCLLTETRPLQFWQRLDTWARWAVAVIAPLPILTPLLNRDRDSNLLIAFAPVVLIVIELLARRYQRLTSVNARRALIGYTSAAAALVAIGLVLSRPGGFRAETLRLVVSNTGEHLRQLVGDLGWLDTAVPSVAVFLFWAIVGGLALVVRARVPALGAGLPRRIGRRCRRRLVARARSGRELRRVLAGPLHDAVRRRPSTGARLEAGHDAVARRPSGGDRRLVELVDRQRGVRLRPAKMGGRRHRFVVPVGLAHVGSHDLAVRAPARPRPRYRRAHACAAPPIEHRPRRDQSSPPRQLGGDRRDSLRGALVASGVPAHPKARPRRTSRTSCCPSSPWRSWRSWRLRPERRRSRGCSSSAR